jgi:hypothetical protein
LNAALREHWIWFQRSDVERPWNGLEFEVLPEAKAIFHASVRITLGEGTRILFWVDAWIGGSTADAIAPDLMKLVRPGVQRMRTVQQGLTDSAWVRDIAGELSVNVVVQFMRLWTALRGLATGVGADRFAWKWTADGSFSSKMAYRAFFFRRTALPGVAQVWHSFAPFKVKFHAWLALRRRCWTADRLARRGLPTHTLCKLCHVSAEMLDHLSLQCPYATVVWSGTWQRLGLAIPLPDAQSTLEDWWPAAVEHLSRDDSKRANSLIMLAL